MKKPTGYYKVKFYNHSEVKIMYWNGEKWETFPSDRIPMDEIEDYETIGFIKC